MRRAAFGAPAWKLERLAEQPYEDLVESLVEVDVKPRPEEDLLERFNTQHADEESGVWTGARWFYRMINSERVLEEKVALFWHNFNRTRSFIICINQETVFSAPKFCQRATIFNGSIFCLSSMSKSSSNP